MDDDALGHWVLAGFKNDGHMLTLITHQGLNIFAVLGLNVLAV